MRIDGRAWIDHRDIVHDVAVRPRTGHDAGVRRGEPGYPAVEALGLARDEIVGRLAGLLRIAPVDLEVRGFAAPEDLRPVPALRPAGAVLFDLGQRARVLERGARLGEAREILERGLCCID